jgi:hypothetical protein
MENSIIDRRADRRQNDDKDKIRLGRAGGKAGAERPDATQIERLIVLFESAITH